MYGYVTVAYNFEIIFAKLDKAELKLEELRKKKDQLYTLKTHKYVATNFLLVAHYSKEVLTKEN